MPGRRVDEVDASYNATEELGPGLLVTGTSSGRVRFREYRIEVVEGPDAGRVVRASRASIVIGSSSDADLVLTDKAVSRAHARMLPHVDGVDIADLGSKNGVYVHGAKVQRCRVKPGTEITIGRSVIRVSTEDHERPLPPSSRTRYEHLSGKSRAMREVFAMLELIGSARTPVLVEGERGVGKRRVAEALHRAAGIGSLVSVEAFDFSRERVGEVLGTEGVLVIQHLEELSPEASRALADRLDAEEPPKARVIATFRGDAEGAVRGGKLDRALFLAFSAARVRVPPLRERTEDLPILVRELLEELGQPDIPLAPEDLGRLTAYDWPDNVRELKASLERVVTFRGAKEPEAEIDRTDPDEGVGVDLPYKEARTRMLVAFEREYVRGLLARHGGNVSKASRAAGIDRVYLHRLIKKYELD
ncbi:MAG: sigma 54-dependent Fis family transcriptional regulator [Deltaproteobacteria bacterium]|nr:sigma 54-dependent Fis family transcriptional regulator [Deltaproteobacteria bacterium]